MRPPTVLRFNPRREPLPQPPLIGVVLLYGSLWAVWGLVAWAVDDVAVGALVALVYAVLMTVYLDRVW